MTFFDIFSKRKTKHEEKEMKKIIADFREKNSLVSSELVHLGADVEFKQLLVGDFLIGETAVERKTAGDFVSSMINKRLFRQLEEIRQYKNHFLIIEGSFDDLEFKNKNAIKGMILSVLTDYKVPILYCRDEKETAEFLFLLSNKEKRTTSLRASRIFLSENEQKQYVLEGFPGIGPKSAEKLLKKFGTLRRLFNVSEEEIKKEIGKKSEAFRLLD